MKPKKSASDDPQGSLFQVELVKFIGISHPLAVLAGKIDWDAFEKSFGAYFCEDNGAPANQSVSWQGCTISSTPSLSPTS